MTKYLNKSFSVSMMANSREPKCWWGGCNARVLFQKGKVYACKEHPFPKEGGEPYDNREWGAKLGDMGKL